MSFMLSAQQSITSGTNCSTFSHKSYLQRPKLASFIMAKSTLPIGAFGANIVHYVGLVELGLHLTASVAGNWPEGDIELVISISYSLIMTGLRANAAGSKRTLARLFIVAPLCASEVVRRVDNAKKPRAKSGFSRLPSLHWHERRLPTRRWLLKGESTSSIGGKSWKKGHKKRLTKERGQRVKSRMAKSHTEFLRQKFNSNLANFQPSKLYGNILKFFYPCGTFLTRIHQFDLKRVSMKSN